MLVVNCISFEISTNRAPQMFQFQNRNHEANIRTCKMPLGCRRCFPTLYNSLPLYNSLFQFPFFHIEPLSWKFHCPLQMQSRSANRFIIKSTFNKIRPVIRMGKCVFLLSPSTLTNHPVRRVSKGDILYKLPVENFCYFGSPCVSLD